MINLVNTNININLTLNTSLHSLAGWRRPDLHWNVNRSNALLWGFGKQIELGFSGWPVHTRSPRPTPNSFIQCISWGIREAFGWQLISVLIFDILAPGPPLRLPLSPSLQINGAGRVIHQPQLPQDCGLAVSCRAYRICCEVGSSMSSRSQCALPHPLLLLADFSSSNSF